MKNNNVVLNVLNANGAPVFDAAETRNVPEGQSLRTSPVHSADPLGNNRFFDAIEQATGQRREAKPRGRPRRPAPDAAPAKDSRQPGLPGLDG